jgi:hypothetical protein
VRFTFDTNILVYAIDNQAGARHRMALDLIRRSRGRECIITLQALAELFRALTVKRRIASVKAAEIIQGWRDAVPIVAADEICLVDAMDARRSPRLAVLGRDDLGDRQARRLPIAVERGRTGRAYAWRRHHRQPVRRVAVAAAGRRDRSGVRANTLKMPG